MPNIGIAAKPTISPNSARTGFKILARVSLSILMQNELCPFYVYTGGSVIDASEDGKILKVELDGYLRFSRDSVLLIFQFEDEYDEYFCPEIKETHWLETFDYKPLNQSYFTKEMNRLTIGTEELEEKYSLNEIKSVVDLFQSLRNAGVDESATYQMITNVLGYDMGKIMKIIHYYKAAEKDRHIAVYDDFTIYDATLCWLEDQEEYCKRNEYPLWHP